MAGEVLSICLLYGMVHLPFSHSRTQDYHLINLKKNWTEARRFCRDRYSDLATVESAEDMDRIPERPPRVWIGLYDDPASWKVMTADPNSWRWSATGTTSPGGYQNWANEEPNYAWGPEHCAVIVGGFWLDINCGQHFYFACYNVQSGLKQYTVVSSPMAWASARSYCRQHHHDLAMIENSDENEALTGQLESPGSFVWIGLYREPWRWSDDSPSTFRKWNWGEPNNGNFIEHCGDLSPHFNDLPCDFQIPFICQGALKLRTVTRVNMKLQSTVGLARPDIADQLSRLLKTKLEVDGMDLKLKWRKLPTKQTLKPKIKNC